jgi:hypothetical protein
VAADSLGRNLKEIVMAIVSALVFLAAFALILVVVAATLIPALPRIAAVLAGAPAVEPPLVTVTRRRAAREHPAATRPARRLSEAA